MNRSSSAGLKLLAGTAALALSMAACGNNSSTPDASDSNSAPVVSSTAPETSAPVTTSAAPATTAPPTTTYAKADCKAGATSATGFKVGGILPLTGSLAFLGPPEIAGVGLAVADINAAGGVNGKKACTDIEDSGDSNDLTVSTQSAKKLITGKPSVVIGAASSSVSENVFPAFTSNKITEVSPANTSTTLSGASPFYFRTAPPDTVQGAALGTLIAQDGNQRIAFLVFNDDYGTGLRNTIEKTIKASGGSCTYGCMGDGDEFPPGSTSFSSDVSAAIASKPDAIVILAFDETKSIVPELKSQGWDMSKTYYSDGNTADYTGVFPKGTLTGAQGTIPGADPSDTFKGDLQAWNMAVNNKKLSDYAYGAESYDATILAALAAVKGGKNDSATVQANYLAVTGANGGMKCKTFAACVKLIKAGKDIEYTGPSGIGPLNKDHDPTSAFIGIYDFQADNSIKLATTVQGSL